MYLSEKNQIQSKAAYAILWLYMYTKCVKEKKIGMTLWYLLHSIGKNCLSRITYFVVAAAASIDEHVHWTDFFLKKKRAALLKQFFFWNIFDQFDVIQSIFYLLLKKVENSGLRTGSFSIGKLIA